MLFSIKDFDIRVLKKDKKTSKVTSFFVRKDISIEIDNKKEPKFECKYLCRRYSRTFKTTQGLSDY